MFCCSRWLVGGWGGVISRVAVVAVTTTTTATTATARTATTTRVGFYLVGVMSPRCSICCTKCLLLLDMVGVTVLLDMLEICSIFLCSFFFLLSVYSCCFWAKRTCTGTLSLLPPLPRTFLASLFLPVPLFSVIFG